MFGRLSLSVGGARRSLAAAPGGRSTTAGGGGAPVARLRRRAAAVMAAQASEEVCGARGCAAAALGRGQSAAATHSLTASAGARRPLRSMQSIGVVSVVSVTNVYAVSHGIRSPKARVAGLTWARFLAGAKSSAPVPPQTRLPSTQWSSLGAQGCAWSTGEPKCASAARRQHRNVRKPPTLSPRRL